MSRKDKSGTSMLAQHPLTDGKIRPVEELADEFGTNPSTLAALRRATGWAPGKQVSAADYEAALNSLSNRPMGGGKFKPV